VIGTLNERHALGSIGLALNGDSFARSRRNDYGLEMQYGVNCLVIAPRS
jgi:hypothetical protein